jgi:divalent metal cation (Fe/Co/Zn/Cd) transporter
MHMKKQKQVNQPERLAGFTTILLFGLSIIQIVFGEFLAQSVALTAKGIDCIGDGFVSLTV